MWRSSVSVLILLLLIWLTGHHAVTRQAPVTWTTYSSVDGKFSIEFPGRPTSTTRPQGTDSKSSLTYVSSVASSSRTFAVDYFDLEAVPGDKDAIENVLSAARDRLMNTQSLRLIDENEVAVSGYSGRSVTMTSADKRMVFSRLIVARSRVYRVWMNVPASEVTADIVGRFFDSFKVIE